MQCYHCRGTGSGPQDNVPCNLCHGRGEVSRTQLYNDVLASIENDAQYGNATASFDLAHRFEFVHAEDLDAVIGLMLRQHVITKYTHAHHVAYELCPEGYGQ